ncbi:MAG: VIT domain-containing protein [Kofleriaceae bacterium]
MLGRHVVVAVAFCLGCGTPAVIEPPVPALPTHAPWSLTASDGSGLALVRVDANAVIEGPLAFTELHLYFRNPVDRVLEGRFSITLPAGAAVSRFATHGNAGWHEAEVVPKPLARAAYEDALHERQDPALLELGAGNEMSARVFPIPARGDTHLVISYSQVLAHSFVLPLRGLPAITQLDARVDVADLVGRRIVELHERDWIPTRDLVIPTLVFRGVTAGTLVVAPLEPAKLELAPPTAEPITALTLLVDTSASRALAFPEYLARVDELVIRLRVRHGDGLRLRVLAFDQSTATIFDGRVGDFGAPELAALQARGAGGASDLAQAIATIPEGRLVIVGDSVVTAGADPAAQLARFDRVDVVLAAGVRDDRTARVLARGGRRPGDVLELTDRDTAARLGEAVRANIPIAIPGAIWFSPREIPLRSTEPIVIHARFAQPVTTLRVLGTAGTTTIPLAQAPAVLVERAIARAEIEELEVRLADAPSAGVRAELVRQSLAARVVSSETALLVLETDYDYRRYGIERTALASILAIGASGLELRGRTAIVAGTLPEEALRDDSPVLHRESQAMQREETRAARSPPSPSGQLVGAYAEVMMKLAAHDARAALQIATRWRDRSPGDVLAWIAIGEVLEATGDPTGAARAYGSIVDLAPARAELRRFAGERLERTGARSLAIDSYRRAVADRPDQISGHRLLAYALLRDDDYEGAFAAILTGFDAGHPDHRFLGVDRVLGEDAGMIAAVLVARGGDEPWVSRELARRSLRFAERPSTRFILYWETDSNDVDLHVYDRHGDHAFYSSPALASGGALYADVTTGYGPECFAIAGEPAAGPYRIGVHYYAQGPMGYGMGLVQVQRYDGLGTITFEDRPFVIMTDRAYVELGTVD